ncbi:hypothetical protein [Pseudomonas sp. TSRC2-2]|uniref:hypothetical protein n=1 Tax=Pseudomonas sp. TSRC2-2 TaxID=2804571 RepID=UPI003CF1B32C
MTKPKNDPIHLTLPAHVVNMLTQWARLDRDLMRAEDQPARLKLREQRATWANEIVRSVLESRAFPTVGDLATALNERAEAYAAEHAIETALAAQAAKAERSQ